MKDLKTFFLHGKCTFNGFWHSRNYYKKKIQIVPYKELTFYISIRLNNLSEIPSTKWNHTLNNCKRSKINKASNNQY